MIFLDLPLGIVAVFFFVISWVYGWGLLNISIFGLSIKDNFRWSLASMVGIASVISVTYVFVWQIRGIEDPLQAVYDLAVVFLAALPGMIWVDYRLKSIAKDTYIANLQLLVSQFGWKIARYGE